MYTGSFAPFEQELYFIYIPALQMPIAGEIGLAEGFSAEIEPIATYLPLGVTLAMIPSVRAEPSIFRQGSGFMIWAFRIGAMPRKALVHFHTLSPFSQSTNLNLRRSASFFSVDL